MLLKLYCCEPAVDEISNRLEVESAGKQRIHIAGALVNAEIQPEPIGATPGRNHGRESKIVECAG